MAKERHPETVIASLGIAEAKQSHQFVRSNGMRLLQPLKRLRNDPSAPFLHNEA